MKLHLGGHLAWYRPDKNAHVEIHITTPARLVDILEQLNISLGEVGLVVINGELTELSSAVVKESDSVDLYPPIGGGSKP